MLVAMALLLAMALTAAAAEPIADLSVEEPTPVESELTATTFASLEQGDDGVIYGSVTVMVDIELTPTVSTLIAYEHSAQVISDFQGLEDRGGEWDASITWAPAEAWFVTAGYRWKTGNPVGYGGPYKYVGIGLTLR